MVGIVPINGDLVFLRVDLHGDRERYLQRGDQLGVIERDLVDVPLDRTGKGKISLESVYPHRIYLDPARTGKGPGAHRPWRKDQHGAIVEGQSCTGLVDLDPDRGGKAV